MPDKADFVSRRPNFSIFLLGQPGSGKTYSAMSFPKTYVIGCDPAGLDILHVKGNERLLNNLIYWEYLHNESEDDLKALFKETAKSEDRSSIYGCLAHVKELAKKGEVETLVLDGFNYFVDMKWQHINEFAARKSNTTGVLDTQAMYRDLGLFLSRFFASDLMTMGSRQNLNIVVTCHVKRESPDAVEGVSEGKAKRAGKVNKDSDIAPMIEGGFRQRVEGLVSASLYLEHRTERGADGKPITTYRAYTQISRGLDTVLLAKNRYGLPNPLNLTNQSLYEALMKSRAVVTSE